MVTDRAPQPKPPRPRRWGWILTSGLAALLVVAGYLTVGQDLRCGWAGVGPDLSYEDGECIGSTDGSFVFDSRFAGIQKKIEEENHRVDDRLASNSDLTAARIGLLSTLTPTSSSPISPDQMQRSLEGAFVAQRRANHGRELGDPAPLIQLQLVNEGATQQHWKPAVDDLVAMSDDDPPLLAVVGLGVSIETTRDAARELSRAKIPMVSAVATADGLNDGTVPGLLRAGPSNTDFVTALRGYVKSHKELKKAALVFDENEPDLFVSSLKSAYEKRMATYLGKNSPQRYRGGTLDNDAPPGIFTPATQNICQMKADMVFYAGRGGDLDPFLDALSVRPCRSEPISVMFAETGLPLETSQDTLKDSNITIVHAGSYDPGWRPGGTGAPEGFAGFSEAYERNVGDPGSGLDNGYAAAHHDAMATATQAIRTAEREYAQSGESVDGPDDVVGTLFQMNTANAVPAAGGDLSFSSTRDGDPGGKVVPVVEVPRQSGGPERKPYVTPDT